MFDSDRQAPTRARHLVADYCAERHPGVESGAWGTLLLLLSEVVTNAVRYGDPPVELRLTELSGSIRVDVTDRGEQRPVLRETEDLLADGGRGLVLVQRLSTRWGVDEEPDCKTVWFEVPAPTR